MSVLYDVTIHEKRTAKARTSDYKAHLYQHFHLTFIIVHCVLRAVNKRIRNESLFEATNSRRLWDLMTRGLLVFTAHCVVINTIFTTIIMDCSKTDVELFLHRYNSNYNIAFRNVFYCNNSCHDLNIDIKQIILK